MEKPQDVLLLEDVRNHMRGAAPAHDFGHALRVGKSARRMAKLEGANPRVCYLAGILHEWLNLPKNHPDSHRSGDLCAEQVEALLRGRSYPLSVIEGVVPCIRDHAFSKGAAPSTLEVGVLQDADRLDAIGAIGIARCFSTCGELGRSLFSEEDPFAVERQLDDSAFGLDHFFKKLLLIPGRMNTATGMKLAKERLATMQAYLLGLGEELEGDDEDAEG